MPVFHSVIAWATPRLFSFRGLIQISYGRPRPFHIGGSPRKGGGGSITSHYHRYNNILTWLRGFQDKLLYLGFFFVSKSLLGIEGQKKLTKFAILTRKPWSHVRILICRTWPIETSILIIFYMKDLFHCNASTWKQWHAVDSLITRGLNGGFNLLSTGSPFFFLHTSCSFRRRSYVRIFDISNVAYWNLNSYHILYERYISLQCILVETMACCCRGNRLITGGLNGGFGPFSTGSSFFSLHTSCSVFASFPSSFFFVPSLACK